MSLVQVDVGKGDYHDNLSTTKLFFEPSYTLYYKPRSLAIDNYILRFLFYLEKELNRKMFYNVLNIERDGYGWSIPVPIEECNTVKQVEDFYYNMGILTAVSYFINIDDLIYDNIISTNGKIALIDLECSFCIERPINIDMEFVLNSKAGKIFRNSIINSGIIPRYTIGNIYEEGDSDASLSYIPQRSILKKELLLKSDIQQIINSKGIRHSDENHIPKLNGEYKTIKDFYPQYLQGFKKGFYYLINNKKKLYALLDKAAQLEIETRIIYRPTKVYAILINELFNPDSLSNQDYPNIIINSLKNGSYIGLDDKIFESEINQISKYNIPAFKKIIGINNVYDFSNNSLNVTYHEKSDIDFIKNKISNINKTTFNEQVDIIIKSFKVFENIEDSSFNKNISFKSKGNIFETSLFSIVKQIKDSLLINDNDISCIDIFSNVNNGWEVGVCGPGLSNGLDGVAYFFGLYGFFYHDNEYLSISKKIIQKDYTNFLKYVNDDSLFDMVGHVLFSPFQFPTSLVYVNEVLNEVTGEYFIPPSELLSNYKMFFNKHIEKDEHLDFLIGTSGLLFLFYQLYKKTNNNEFLEIFKTASRHLYNNLIFYDEFAFIETVKFKRLGGFSHGNSSLAVSLLLAFDLLKEKKYFEAFKMALKYDQSLFDNNSKAYIDVRYLPNKHFSNAWAHGMGGIALSRLLIDSFVQTKELNQEMIICREYLNTFITNDIFDYTINGGLAGNIEILRALNNKFNINNNYLNENFEKYLESIKKGEKNLISEKGHVHKFINQGIAGLGYSIIRHLFPSKVPSLLILGIDNNFGSKYLYHE